MRLPVVSDERRKVAETDEHHVGPADDRAGVTGPTDQLPAVYAVPYRHRYCGKVIRKVVPVGGLEPPTY